MNHFIGGRWRLDHRQHGVGTARLRGTRIVKSDGEPVSINYMVHDNAVGYQIRDVYVTGTISEFATKRSEFATILRTNGIDGLIASLNKKADDLQG